ERVTERGRLQHLEPQRRDLTEHVLHKYVAATDANSGAPLRQVQRRYQLLNLPHFLSRRKCCPLMRAACAVAEIQARSKPTTITTRRNESFSQKLRACSKARFALNC